MSEDFPNDPDLLGEVSNQYTDRPSTITNNHTSGSKKGSAVDMSLRSYRYTVQPTKEDLFIILSVSVFQVTQKTVSETSVCGSTGVID